MKSILLFIRLIRPIYLFGGILLYALGAGISHYLGENLDWSTYWIGQGWVTAMQLATHFLNEYYDAADDRNNPNRTLLTGGSGAVGDDKIPRKLVLLLAFASLAVVAALTVAMIGQLKPDPVVILIMVLGFLGGFFYSTPPVKLESSGYGELTAAFLTGFLIPTFAFTIQVGNIHRLLLMVTSPLVVLCLGMLIALQMPDYASDLKAGKRTLMVRMGWQNAMTFHNILVMSAYFLVGLALYFGFPRFAALAAVLSFPVAVLEIWQMLRISQGGKPNWKALTINSVATFASMAYLLTYAFWTH